MKYVLLVLVSLFVSLCSYAQGDYWNDRRRYGNQRSQVIRNMRNWEQQEREERRKASIIRNKQRIERQRESMLQGNRSNNNTSNKVPSSNIENSNSNQENEKLLTLVTNGTGQTQEEATKNALRSAIEQTYGTFVSSNTEVLNDDMIKDDIVTVSSGNVKSYKELSVDQSDGLFDVSVQVTISIDQLTKYAQSKGMQAELAGASFVMNMKMRELNKGNELVAIKNLEEKLQSFNGIFDYVIETGEPILDGPSRYKILVKLFFRENSETVRFYKTIYDTMKSLSLSETEMNEYKKINIPYYLYNAQLDYIDNGSPYRYALRNKYNIRESSWYYDPWLMPILINQTLAFTIYDNLGNQYYCRKVEHDNPNKVLWYYKDENGHFVYYCFYSSGGNLNKKDNPLLDYGTESQGQRMALHFNPMIVDNNLLKLRLNTRIFYSFYFYVYYSEEELSKLEYLKVEPRQPLR